MELKQIRKKKGLTQKNVADALHCSVVVYSRYETGDRQPSIETLLKLSDFFDVSVDQILGKKTPLLPTLNSYESTLIDAARRADERARQDAVHLLLLHGVE